MARKRPEQLEQTRREILDAAERCVARHGYEHATLKQIAREASITVPTVYAYFDGKAAVRGALEARMLEDVERLMDVLLPRGLAFGQKLELLLSHQLRLVEARQHRFQFMLQLRSPAELGARYRAALVAWLREQDEHGELRYPAEYTTLVITGTWSACFLDWMRQGAPAGELVALAPQITDTLLGGILSH